VTDAERKALNTVLSYITSLLVDVRADTKTVRKELTQRVTLPARYRDTLARLRAENSRLRAENRKLNQLLNQQFE